MSADDDTVFQNCLLEGKVVKGEDNNGENTVYIDFYKAEPYKAHHRCIIDGHLEFTQPKGSLIENLSEGSIVIYHYSRTMGGTTHWQLVGASI